MRCHFCTRTNFNGIAMYGIADGKWICATCCSTLKTHDGLTTVQIEALIKLCHPDRHRGPMEALATSTTQWLLDWRKRSKRATP
jgi:hypothetical protein